MTPAFDQANSYVGRLLSALHEEDRAGFEAIYQEALKTGDSNRPMFLIVNILVANLVVAVREQVEGEFDTADSLIRDALKDIPDLWRSSESGD